jgi:hypothetical protein
MQYRSLFPICTILLLVGGTGLAQKPKPLCQQAVGRCVDPATVYTYDKPYVGHDEPSILFYSNTPGSGNNQTYFYRLPKDPPTLPKQNGSGGTFTFQLSIAPWFGMAVCDTQSFPEYTSKCAPDSDSNIFDSRDPDSPRWIGYHPGTAFVELQFYPPGWVLWPPGNSCDATRWCAALNIDSLGFDNATQMANNDACLSTVGEETVNFAFVTKNGKAHAPANPVEATLATFTPNPATDLFMNSGDVVKVELYDTPEGLKVVIEDLTTHEKGSMTASAANTFGQVKFDPSGTTCQNIPYNFHPMYSTSGEHTRVPWAAHSYNIAYSDEIGHFDYCSSVEAEGGPCVQKETDKQYCFDASASSRIHIGGCLDADLDFDGPSYRLDWPGTSNNSVIDAKYHPEPLRFTSPIFKSTYGNWENYDRVAFENDMPVFEANCDPFTGTGCSNPPPGAEFYPLYTTAGIDPDNDHDVDGCVWQFGGPDIPGTINKFGGTSTSEFGPLIDLSYPEPGGSITVLEDYRRILNHNPCKAGLSK